MGGNGTGGRSHQLDAGAMAGGRGQAPFARDKHGVEPFGESDIRGVIGREIVPQLPNARQQNVMGITLERQIGEIGESGLARCRIDIAGRDIAADHLGNFDVEQMGSVQALSRIEETCFDGFCSCSAQQRLEHRRGVDDDQRLSRSARTASAGESESLAFGRFAKRSRNSSKLGRSATRRISSRR